VLGGRSADRPPFGRGVFNLPQKYGAVKQAKIGFLFLIFFGAFFFRLKSRKKKVSKADAPKKNKK
jgi:hypothetical protein